MTGLTFFTVLLYTAPFYCPWKNNNRKETTKKYKFSNAVFFLLYFLPSKHTVNTTSNRPIYKTIKVYACARARQHCPVQSHIKKKSEKQMKMKKTNEQIVYQNGKISNWMWTNVKKRKKKRERKFPRLFFFSSSLLYLFLYLSFNHSLCMCVCVCLCDCALLPYLLLWLWW